jgi:hypothetical protein
MASAEGKTVVVAALAGTATETITPTLISAIAHATGLRAALLRPPYRRLTTAASFATRSLPSDLSGT